MEILIIIFIDLLIIFATLAFMIILAVILVALGWSLIELLMKKIDKKKE